MNLAHFSQVRSLLGKVGAVICLLMLLALLDGIVAKFREPFNVIPVIPGMTVDLDGPLYGRVDDVGELTYWSSSDQLRLTFANIKQGYFLGGVMWQGQLTAGDQITPGKYTLRVRIKNQSPGRPLPPFRVVVYPDAYSLRQGSLSLIQKKAGISAWAAAALCLPFVVLAFGLVFLLSQKMEKMMAQRGQAEIYRVIRQDGRYLVKFGLGTAHGIHPGALLFLCNDRGQSLGSVEVQEASATDSLASIISDQEIKPGYIVSRGSI